MATERAERRAETNAVSAYLNSLRTPKPRQSREALLKRRGELETTLEVDDKSPMERLKLVQQRMDVDAALARLDDTDRTTELEEAFVKVAGSWAARSGISREALREVGVPADVLKRAGL